METNEEITEERFNKLLIKFLLNEPFFSTIVRSMKKVKTNSIPTAGGTFFDDLITLYWNPKFIGGLSSKKVFGLLKHECYHLIFKHLTTRKQDPHLMWNIATDLAINSTIPLDELPEGGLIPGQDTTLKTSENTSLPKKLKEKASKLSSFIKTLPRDKASEWYMEKLRNEKGMEETINDLFKPKPGNKSEGEQSAGSAAGFDHHFENDMSDSEKELMDAKVKKIVKDAVDRADRTNSWGSATSAMRQKIREMLKTSIDWRHVLRYYCGTKQRSEKTRSIRKINRKYPYIHSGRKIKHTSNLAIYIDQSGSVRDDDIALFFGALSELSKKVTFTVYHFDTEVDDNSKYVWKKKSGFKTPRRTMAGGTCFDCVETHYRKLSSAYDGYIIMTDGCAPKPKSCISKRCWVLLPGQKLYFAPDNKDTVVKMKK